MEDFASNVSWLFTAQWRLRMGNWNQIQHAVRAIDRTWHKIEIPTVIPQRPLYLILVTYIFTASIQFSY